MIDDASKTGVLMLLPSGAYDKIPERSSHSRAGRRTEMNHGQDVVVRGPRPAVDGDDWRLV